MLIPLHFGALHAYELLLIAVLAFGPFVVLFVVVYIVRKRDISQDEAAPPSTAGETKPPANSR